MSESHYMLIPVTTKKEDWKHKEKTKLSIKKAIELQDFFMGRISNVEINGKSLKTNSSIDKKTILNDFLIVEIDRNIASVYTIEMQETAIDNNVQLLSHTEMLQYIKDDSEVLV